MIYTPITDTLQVTNDDICPRLITPNGSYTLHMNDMSVYIYVCILIMIITAQ